MSVVSIGGEGGVDEGAACVPPGLHLGIEGLHIFAGLLPGLGLVLALARSSASSASANSPEQAGPEIGLGHAVAAPHTAVIIAPDVPGVPKP